MDQQVLLDAIVVNLELVDSLAIAALSSAVVSAFTATYGKEIVVGPLSLRSRVAFVALAGIFLYSLLSIAIGAVRIRDALDLINHVNRETVLTIMLTHNAMLNPYYFVPINYVSDGLALISVATPIIVWWIGFASLFIIARQNTSILLRLFVSLYLIGGILTLVSFFYLGNAVVTIMRDVAMNDFLETSVYLDVKRFTILKSAGMAAGIALGALLGYYLSVRAKPRSNQV